VSGGESAGDADAGDPAPAYGESDAADSSTDDAEFVDDEAEFVDDDAEIMGDDADDDVAVEADAGPVEADAGSERDDDPVEQDTDPADEDAEIIEGGAELIDEAESGTDDVDASERTETEDGAPEESNVDAESDDGLILDDEEPEPRERGHGEWPDPEGTRQVDARDDGPSLEDVGGDVDIDGDADDVDAQAVEYDAELIDDDDDLDADPRAWPNQDREDEGFAAEPGNGESADVSFGGGLTPQASGQASDDDEATLVGGGDSGDFVRAQSPPLDRRDDPGGVTEFFCPNCGVSKAAGKSSMRAGDICPECHRGYIAERDVTEGAQ
jgi:hypothetical protein